MIELAKQLTNILRNYKVLISNSNRLINIWECNSSYIIQYTLNRTLWYVSVCLLLLLPHNFYEFQFISVSIFFYDFIPWIYKNIGKNPPKLNLDHIYYTLRHCFAHDGACQTTNKYMENYKTLIFNSNRLINIWEFHSSYIQYTLNGTLWCVFVCLLLLLLHNFCEFEFISVSIFFLISSLEFISISPPLGYAVNIYIHIYIHIYINIYIYIYKYIYI